MKTSFVTSLLLVSLTAVALANEPLWTDAQRLAKRDVVTVATVVSTQRVSKIDQHNDLFLEMGSDVKKQEKDTENRMHVIAA